MPAKKRRLWRWLAPLGLAAAVAGFVGYRQLRPREVVVVPVTRGTAMDAVYATGTVEAEERVTVRAKSAGSIAELLVREGQAVKKGELLARIDNPAAAFDLKRGKAELSAASAQAGPSAPQIAALRARAKSLAAELDTARIDLQRSERLLATGARAQAEVDWARMRVSQLESAIVANEADQRAVRIELSANAARSAAQVEGLATLSTTPSSGARTSVSLTRQRARERDAADAAPRQP